MIKAFFVDFYGTLVHEDGEVIKKIIQIIFDTGCVKDKGEIGIFWWSDFQELFRNSSGETFETQRALEEKSLVHTLVKFGSDADPKELSEMLEVINHAKNCLSWHFRRPALNRMK